MATPVAKTYDWKQALRTHEQAPDRVTLYRILERLMQASIVQRYTDSARTQRFALTLRATVGLFECDNCHHVIPIEQDPALEAAIELVKSHLTGHGMT
ncbi:transcriptional repressor, partial [Acinetobacter baumannii]|nr:transcriptional repressor [Acinetobacter baumannii]